MCPESPRWYMKKGRYPEAWKSLMILRNNPIQVARDIYYISAQLEIEKQLVGKTNYITRFTQLFTIPRVRRANLAAFTVMIAQQMCGINIIAFYSTTIFSDAGMSEFKAMIGSFGFGLVNWIFAFPAFYTIDTVGLSRAHVAVRVPPLTDCLSSLADEACSSSPFLKCSGRFLPPVSALSCLRAPRTAPTTRALASCASSSSSSVVSGLLVSGELALTPGSILLSRRGSGPVHLQRRGLPPVSP